MYLSTVLSFATVKSHIDGRWFANQVAQLVAENFQLDKPAPAPLFPDVDPEYEKALTGLSID